MQMPDEGPQVLLAFVPLLLGISLQLYAQWRVRRMAVRHGELGGAVIARFPWPSVVTYTSRASQEFQREYRPFMRRILVIAWSCYALFIFLLVRAAG